MHAFEWSSKRQIVTDTKSHNALHMLLLFCSFSLFFSSTLISHISKYVLEFFYAKDE